MIYGKIQKKKTTTCNQVWTSTFFAVLTDTSEGAIHMVIRTIWRGTVEIAPTDAGGSDVLTPITVRMKHQTTLKN